MKIKHIHAREILDSRGNPTVQTEIQLTNGIVSRASVPSGASTGVHEALELRDSKSKRYGGKGVLTACKNVNTKILKKIKGQDVRKLQLIDKAMIELDGTKNKSKLGANAILSVSLAAAHAGAAASKRPLYEHIRKTYNLKLKGYKLPVPTMNVFNGGKHANNGISIQEFMIVPHHRKFKERVRMGAEVFHKLKKLLADSGYLTLVGDEGGFADGPRNKEQIIKFLISAIKKAGYKPGKDINLGMDVAASEFFDKGKYAFHAQKVLWSPERMMAELYKWIKKYPFELIEDPLAEDDWENWRIFTRKKGDEVTIVGDDLFVTNAERLQKGIDMSVANAILIKVNQIGSLTETIDAIKLARKHKYKVVVSHRSGETTDTTIADLAVAVNAEYIKTGSLSRSERVSKYNRLMEIEEEL